MIKLSHILTVATLTLISSNWTYAQEGNSLRQTSRPSFATTPQTQPQNQPPTQPQAQPQLILHAQPTAPAQGQRQPAGQPAQTGMSPEVYAAVYNADASNAQGNSLQNQPAPFIDHNVAPAVHVSAPKKDLAPLAQFLNSSHNATLATNRSATANSHTPDDTHQQMPSSLHDHLNASYQEPAADPITADHSEATTEAPAASSPLEKKFDRSRLQTLIKSLAINTGIVMCFGIGFILVAKKFVKGKTVGTKKAKPGIEIKSTLKLAPKSDLHLIEVNDHQLIVAIDQNGIRSVVRLNESFASTLDSLDGLDQLNQAMETSGGGTYSLGMIGKKVDSAIPDSPTLESRMKSAIERASETAQPEPTESPEESVRKKMEAALAEHGLKDLILESLRKG